MRIIRRRMRYGIPWNHFYLLRILDLLPVLFKVCDVRFSCMNSESIKERLLPTPSSHDISVQTNYLLPFSLLS